MKRFALLVISLFLYSRVVIAQKKVIDTTDHSPIVAATIFDNVGNIVGFTLNNGYFPDIPESAYPITLRSIGYEQLIIEKPEEKTWEMIPAIYELGEIEIVPVKRNVLKQLFYVREYSSLNNEEDTIADFMEYMAVRFIPTTKDAKFGGNSSLHILNSRGCLRYKVVDVDTLVVTNKSVSPSALSLCELENSQIDASESFKQQSGPTKFYQKPGKSGMYLIKKQNAQTFTIIKDELAKKKNHKLSPFILKLFGLTMDVNKCLITQTFRANDKYIYQPKDIMEANIVIEANCRGKYFRKILKSEKPVILRSMMELYLVDSEYLSKEEAKQEYNDKENKLNFTIPSTIPPLNAVTQKMVMRAKTETDKRK